MANKNIFDELSEQLARILPQANAVGEDLKKTLATGMKQGIEKMDLVTREEFDHQVQALKRAEQRIALLEETVKRLEEEVQRPDI